jgi:putative hydrolases of HD superfamily
MQRLQQQLSFAIELDKLKNVLRQTLLTDSSRRENTAEHTWHIALMALVFAEYAAAPIDLNRVVRMLLVHDIVEIDAGDTFAFDAGGNATKAEREKLAADRIFSMLPPNQATELLSLWQEFEVGNTPDAQFANAIDRLQPFLQNTRTEGGTWRIHNVTRSQVLRRLDPIRLYLPRIWPEVSTFVDHASEQGWIRRDQETAV